MKKIAVVALATLLASSAFAVVPFKASACTNSYDTASDGSNCGGRASGCRSGGRGGYC